LLTDVPEAAVRVVGDYQALELVVNNLLDNALKYTPQGGKVWVRVDTDGKSAILEVVDTGIGIAREHHERIFERFYRVDKARSREVGGTGLGLSIVKHICKLLGGSVSIASDIGVGSTFRVRLPLSTPAL
jgi:two-component system phosphate regulon sensor histidine kinase PhoR